MAWDRTSRHTRGYGTAWDKLRVFVLRRDKGLCQTCLPNGRTELASQVDHIKPKAKGGTDDMSNLAAICGDCHRAKTQRESAEAQGRTHRPRPTIGMDGWPVQ